MLLLNLGAAIQSLLPLMLSLIYRSTSLQCCADGDPNGPDLISYQIVKAFRSLPVTGAFGKWI